MKNKDEETSTNCPNCKGSLIIIQEWVNIHDKESLWHCLDCDEMYLVYYEIVKVEVLKQYSLSLVDFLRRCSEE